MALCPHCKTPGEAPLSPCVSGDGFFCVDDADIYANPGNDLLGRAIGGRFVVLGTLGAGSMAQVYRAHQLEVDRSVALKVFRIRDMVEPGTDGVSAMAASRERFAQEARVLGKLAHPNCVTVFDFGADESAAVLYIAMEHVGGVSLRRAMNRGLRLDAIYEIVEQVLLALREAHVLDIVHRDLKPENIILSFRQTSDQPVVKVVDFGIAKLLGHDRLTDMTQIGALFGTPAYMSPEQCRGEVDTVGPHSDIYALGCILFEMLTGRLPYDAPGPTQMIRMHTDAPIPDVVPRAGIEVSRDLAAFVTRCLQKKAEERFIDADGMLRALNALRDTSGGRTSVERPRPTAKRVVVPTNQISGMIIVPPRLDQPAPDPTPPKVEVPSQPAPNSRPAPQTSGDVTGGISMDRIPSVARSGSNSTVVLVAFVFVVLACIALFSFMWLMVSSR